jgi:hypothetical protein
MVTPLQYMPVYMYMYMNVYIMLQCSNTRLRSPHQEVRLALTSCPTLSVLKHYHVVLRKLPEYFIFADQYKFKSVLNDVFFNFDTPH